MSKTKQVLILAIIAVVSTVVGLIATNSFGGSSVQANQGGRSGVQRWEYCAITEAYWLGSDLDARAVVVIRYFQVGGVKDETVEFVPEFGKKVELKDAFAKAMAKLGNEGWEMVSKETDGRYFKRPKQ
jgi:hypothetical protein